MNRHASVWLLSAFVLAWVPAPCDGPDVRSAIVTAAAADTQPPIGTGRMRSDGTIEIDFFQPHGRATYPPAHPEYRQVLEHLGGLKPGETKPVPPWPDAWDGERVEQAARAHATAKGWKPGDYTMAITGTDAEGHAVVTLAYTSRGPAPGGTRALQIRVSPKTYQVVREIALP